MITKIDKDTVEETTKKIIDLRPLRKRAIEIDIEIKETEKESEMVYNDFKDMQLRDLKEEKESILNKLDKYK